MSNSYDRGKQFFLTSNTQRYPAEGNLTGTTTAGDGVAPAGTRVRLQRILERVPGAGGTVTITDGAGVAYTDLNFKAPIVSSGQGPGLYIDLDIPLDNGLGAVNSAAANSFYIEYELED